ncbi:MAG TPA: hypothetical protein VEF71_10635 [Streptosporangiaceae bacterium]|nr:hypothetical protein [Streptosporangiaceae bacterium]
MAAAEISRPSWPYRPARDPGDRALPDRAQTDQGPAHEIIGEMASLLLDTRSGLLLGGIVLSAITIGIGLEAAFSARVLHPGVVGAFNFGLLIGLMFCWLMAIVMLARAAGPVHHALSHLRWRTGAPLDPRPRWMTLPPAETTPEEWAWTRAHLLLGAAHMNRSRIRVADTWTYITAAFFLVWSALLLLGL